MSDVVRRFSAALTERPDGNHNQAPTYRRDIDGLRAIAILAVVGYHLSPALVPGGFLGVDIFFVISGFLISTIIFTSLSNNSFSFIEFYARRIRRIFPALILVVGVCFFIGRQALLPNEIILFGRHIASSMSFWENYRLWSEAGYFDISTSLKPLMHLWSLAIEEQFYLAFPLLIWGSFRLRLNLLGVVVVIFTASFAFYLHDIAGGPIAAFFSPQDRFWELMAGAILAYATLHYGGALQTVGETRWAPGISSRSLASFCGVALLGGALFALNFSQPLPGLLGEVFSVLGATLLIASGPAGLVNRFLLSNRLMVFVGLISYPLYLWHWPLLSLLTIIDGAVPPLYQRAIAVAASFGLATLTYRFIELPIRRGRSHRRKVTAGLVAASIALLALGIYARRLAPVYDAATANIIQLWVFAGHPAPQGLYFDKEYQFAALGNNDQKKIIFIGDGHTEQYIQAVATVFKRFPESDLPEVIFFYRNSYEDFQRAALGMKKMATDKAVKIVILSDFWAAKRGSSKIHYEVRCCGTGLMQTWEGRRPSPLTKSQTEALDKDIENEIDGFEKSGKEVYIILDNPFGDELAPRSLLDRSFFHKIRINVVPFLKKDAIELDEPARSEMKTIARDTGAAIIDPFEYLCDDSVCPALSPDGMPIYRDYDHLSLYAVTHLVHYLDFIAQQRTAE